MASDDRMEESDSDWSDCPELEEEPDEATDALFAQYKGSPLDCLQADQSLLGWNLKSTGAKEQFEILDYIKAVNFIRSKSKTSELSKMSEAEFLGLRKTWQSEEYLKPANHMDAFLCFDWDDMKAPELVPTNQMVQNKSKLDELKKELGSISIPTGITKDESYFDGYSDYRNLLSNKIRFRIPERKKIIFDLLFDFWKPREIKTFKLNLLYLRRDFYWRLDSVHRMRFLSISGRNRKLGLGNDIMLLIKHSEFMISRDFQLENKEKYSRGNVAR